MTSADLVAALVPIAAALDDLGAPFFLTGSIASSVHGMPRSSVDVDLVVDLLPEHVDAFAARLEPSFYLDRDRIRIAVHRRQSFNVIHLASMFKVDIFLSKRRPFDERAFTRATPNTLEESLESRTFPVASPEDVILSKLDWFKAGGKTFERQWSDIVGVIRAKGSTLQLDYLRSTARSLSVLDLLERTLMNAGESPH